MATIETKFGLGDVVWGIEQVYRNETCESCGTYRTVGRHRCDAEACRALWPDVVGGLYMIEEMPDEPPEVVEEGTSTSDRVKLALGLKPEPPPSLPDGGEGEASEEGAGPDLDAEVEIRLVELRRLSKAEPKAFKAVLAEVDIDPQDLGKQDVAMLDDILIAVKDAK